MSYDSFSGADVFKPSDPRCEICGVRHATRDAAVSDFTRRRHDDMVRAQRLLADGLVPETLFGRACKSIVRRLNDLSSTPRLEQFAHGEDACVETDALFDFVEDRTFHYYMDYVAGLKKPLSYAGGVEYRKVMLARHSMRFAADVARAARVPGAALGPLLFAERRSFMCSLTKSLFLGANTIAIDWPEQSRPLLARARMLLSLDAPHYPDVGQRWVWSVAHECDRICVRTEHSTQADHARYKWDSEWLEYDEERGLYCVPGTHGSLWYLYPSWWSEAPLYELFQVTLDLPPSTF